jgi:hypothetical protein
MPRRITAKLGAILEGPSVGSLGDNLDAGDVIVVPPLVGKDPPAQAEYVAPKHGLAADGGTILSTIPDK